MRSPTDARSRRRAFQKACAKDGSYPASAITFAGFRIAIHGIYSLFQYEDVQLSLPKQLKREDPAQYMQRCGTEPPAMFEEGYQLIPFHEPSMTRPRQPLRQVFSRPLALRGRIAGLKPRPNTSGRCASGWASKRTQDWPSFWSLRRLFNRAWRESLLRVTPGRTRTSKTSPTPPP